MTARKPVPEPPRSGHTAAWLLIACGVAGVAYEAVRWQHPDWGAMTAFLGLVGLGLGGRDLNGTIATVRRALTEQKDDPDE